MNVTMEAIQQIWCEVLGLEEIAPDAKFYDLGGNSVTFLIIVDEVFQRFQIEIPIEELNQLGTVARMTNYVNER